jgi:hypothetical protein
MGNRSNGRQKAGKLREFTTVVTVQFVVSTNARSHGEAERKLDLGFYGKKGEAVGPLWRAEQDGDVRIRVAHKRADMIVEKRHGAIEREIREHGKSPSTDLAAAVAKLSAKRTVVANDA